MNKSLIIAALMMISCSKGTEGEANPDWGQQPPYNPVSGQSTFNVSGTEAYVNVMGNTQSVMPNFPALSVKKGYLRGYVADVKGKPLKGAYIGVRATIGLDTRAEAVTNDKGYYEMKLPLGAITYFATGYEMDYGQGKAVVGLFPSDDNSTGFGSESGQVKNFVMQSYGLANKSELSRQPYNPTNYYGGSINIDYSIDWENYIQEYFHENDVIEITLTPDGPGIFGDNKSFVIRKTVGIAKLTIVNIPVGKYNINTKLVNGSALKMSAAGPHANSFPFWGLKPGTASTGPSTVMFTPTLNYSIQKAVPHKSNWESVDIRLQK